MKTNLPPARWVLLLVVTSVLLGGCKIWNPRSWGMKPRQGQVQRWQYEAASPYAAAQGEPVAGQGLIAVGGMGYDGAVNFVTPDGRRVVAESGPAGSGRGMEGQSGGLAELDARIQRERFGESMSEASLRGGAGGAGGGVGRGPENAAPPADPYANLPKGIPVPGKLGFVNLPDPYSGLPQVDVRGIASGTPVEVPNPLNPAEKIRFRVP